MYVRDRGDAYEGPMCVRMRDRCMREADERVYVRDRCERQMC
jgi:hypothetical protein